LGIIDPRTHANNFRYNVKEHMHTLLAEMDIISISLIIQNFIFFNKLNKEHMSFVELLTNNTMLMDKLYGLDKLAVILPVFVG
jgi:hypothetical protein